MLARFAQRITQICVGRPGLTIGVFAVLFAIGLGGASRLEMRLNYLELLPESDEAVQDLHWMLKKAGSEGYLVTGITGGTREQRLKLAEHWTAIQSKKPELRYAEYRYDVAFFRKHAASLLPLDQLQSLRKELEKGVEGAVNKQLDLGLDDEPASEPVVDNDALEKTINDYEKQIPKEFIESDDGTEVFTLAKPAIPSGEVGRIHEILDAYRIELGGIVKQPEYKGLAFSFGGPMVFQEAFDNGIRGDLGRASGWALVLATFFLLVATRRPIASLLILLPVAVAISITLALAALFIGHLTIVSGILVAVLLGLGVEFGIHLVLRTAEARGQKSTVDAVMEAAPETMTGAFSGAVTNGAAFGVLLLCDFRAFREFGAIAACGILLSWLFSYALLPAMLVKVEQWKPGWALRIGERNNRPINIPRGLAFVVLVAFPVASLYGIASIPKIEVERSFVRLHGDHHPDPTGVRAAKAMNASLTPVIAWLPNIEDARKLEAIYDKLAKADKAPKGTMLGGSLSLARVAHEDWDVRQPELDRIRQLLRRVPTKTKERFAGKIQEVQDALDAPRVGLKDVPAAFTRKFTPLDGDGTFVLINHTRPVDDADDLDEFVGKVEEGLGIARQQKLNVHMLSDNRVAVHIFRQVFKDAPFIAWSASLVALLTLFALLRSVRETLIVFTPIALGMLFMIAGMRLYGVKLNFINMAVIPSIFTVAIDNTVHLYHRYHEEGRSAMPTILRHTGAAVLIATCVNASGYGPTLMAGFYGVKSFGIVSSFGMLGMLLATVVWFPLLLMNIPERKH